MHDAARNLRCSQLGRARSEGATSYQAVTVLAILGALLAGCSRRDEPNSSITTHHQSAPGQAATVPDAGADSLSRRGEKLSVLTARLMDAQPVFYNVNCLGAAPGDAEPQCNLAESAQIMGLEQTLEGGILKVLSIDQTAPELVGITFVELTLVVEGRADALPFDERSRAIHSLYPEYVRLARGFGHPVLKNVYPNWNRILATTRALKLLDSVHQRIEHTLATTPNAADRLEIRWRIVVHESRETGAAHRGALLHAQLRLGMRSSTFRGQLVVALEGAGWRMESDNSEDEEVP